MGSLNVRPPMEFRAEFKEMLGFAAVFSLIAVLSLWVGAMTGTPWLIAISIFSFGLLAAIRIRYRVILDDNTIRSRNLFAERSIRLSDIVRFERAADLGYLASRFCGPETYEIADREQSFRINFKFFSLDCMREVSEKLNGITNDRSGP